MRDPQFAKFVLLVNGAVPLALLGWDAYWHHLGANPVEFALRTTGMLALVFLLLSLTVTPARKITGSNAFSHFRRMLGLFAFFYGLVHLGIYLVLYRSFDLLSAWKDIIARPFIWLGMAALVLMIPLAATSTNAMIKRLGAARWKRLHRLVYPAAIAASIHYLLVAKVFLPQPMAFAAVVGGLLAYRISSASRTRAKSKNLALKVQRLSR
jgi:DMSO/TMAO reductase YedYZ heme-binding membrane subunit